MTYATTGKRFGAYLIDQLIITAAFYLVHIVTFLITEHSISFIDKYFEYGGGRFKFFSIIVYVCALIVMAVLEAGDNQATVGKRACKIIVTKPDGTKISMIDALTRNSAKMLPELLYVIFGVHAGNVMVINLGSIGYILVIVSFIMICAGSQKKSIHDYLAATVVIPKEMARSLTPEIIVNAAKRQIYEMPIQNTVINVPEPKPVEEPKPIEPVVNTEPAPSIIETVPVVEEPKKTYKVLLTSGQFVGKVYSLDKPIVFGREPSKCTLVFADNTRGISRVHGKIYLENGNVYVEDLGSSQGTFTSDEKNIPAHVPYRLNEGDSFYPANKDEMFKIIFSE